MSIFPILRRLVCFSRFSRNSCISDDGCHHVAWSVWAIFQNIGDVRIGRVTAIDPNITEFSARVTMAIEKIYDEVPWDTAASILTSGMLDARFVGLEPGADEEFLGDGDEI